MDDATASAVFDELRDIMKRNAPGLEITADAPGQFTLESRDRDASRKRRWFGAVQTKKKYVSYHLMPIYENPALLGKISPELKKRMQGKSCFNFTGVDRELFSQLAELTSRGRDDFG